MKTICKAILFLLMVAFGTSTAKAQDYWMLDNVFCNSDFSSNWPCAGADIGGAGYYSISVYDGVCYDLGDVGESFISGFAIHLEVDGNGCAGDYGEYGYTGGPIFDTSAYADTVGAYVYHDGAEEYAVAEVDCLDYTVTYHQPVATLCP